MDPNENLKEQRAILEWLYCNETEVVSPAPAAKIALKMSRLASLTEAMDKWLTGGGFLPRAWDHTNTLPADFAPEGS